MYFKTLLNILVFSLLAINISAQNNIESAKIRDKIWNKIGNEYQNTTIPDKWKNESAIILLQDFQYHFDRKRNEVSSEISFHLRIALLDKAAVKEYSEFSFTEYFVGTSNHQYNRGRTYNGFKIIKPNGTERIVDMKNSVSVHSDIFDNPVKKIAIPDLQEGDIIDFYYHTIEVTNAEYGYHSFSPILATLGANYPIAYSRRKFEVDNTFFVNYRSLNGAPKIKYFKEESSRIFTLNTLNIEKIEAPYWFYPYRSLPTIKFQVMHSKNPLFNNYLSGFVSDKGILKSKLDTFDIANFGNLLVSKLPKINKVDIDKLKDFTAKNGNYFDGLSSRERTKQVYYYLYHVAIKERLERYSLSLDKAEIPGLSDYSFVQNMAAFFNKLKLRGELLLTPSRDFTSMEDALFKGEFGFIIRSSGQGDLYFGNVNLHPHTNSIPTEYEGAEAYVFPFGRETWEPQKETLPISNYKSNRTVVSSEFSFDSNMEKMKLHNNTKTFGHNRDWFQYRLLKMYDYLINENRRMAIPSILTEVSGNEKVGLSETILEYKKSSERECIEVLENLVSNELKTVDPEISNFKIIKNGRFDEGSFEFEYDAEFTGLLQKAGDNYLFNVGFLIGQQKEIKERNMTRKEDIYMSNARSQVNIISCTIPADYNIEGLEKLTLNVVNETGGFISSASMNGNILNIKTEKWFTNNFEKAENWSKMVDFLEAAYEFTGVKILLKKK